VSRCAGCGAENVSGVAFCRMCGLRLASSSPAPPPEMQRPAVFVGGGFRLTLLNQDGSPKIIHQVRGDGVDIGRTEGDLLIDDPQLAARHARIVTNAGQRLLVPIDNRNGVYVRLRAPRELGDGDTFLAGKQVLQFEVVSAAERGVVPGFENGVLFFGTPGRPPWGRLRQLTASGVTRDVYHLGRPEIVIGREKADVVFSDDESMSRQHARISLRHGHVLIEDLASSNGTFARLYGPHRLSSGDVLRAGDQVFRFDDGG
jgi:pSer/pThr/pTyr-binding forkhead associated (FHA) protein